MNEVKFIFIYDMPQAEFIIRETRGLGLFRIGVGKYNDPLVSFYPIDSVKKAMDKWKNKENLK